LLVFSIMIIVLYILQCIHSLFLTFSPGFVYVITVVFLNKFNSFSCFAKRALADSFSCVKFFLLVYFVLSWFSYLSKKNIDFVEHSKCVGGLCASAAKNIWSMFMKHKTKNYFFLIVIASYLGLW